MSTWPTSTATTATPRHPHQHDHDHGHHHPHSHDTARAYGRSFARNPATDHREPLSAWVKDKSIAVFHRLAVAEGRIHGVPPEQVTFHEVGAVDSIVDIVGRLHRARTAGQAARAGRPGGRGLRLDRLRPWPLPDPGAGDAGGPGRARHSRLPMRRTHELVTPTGAALLAEFVESFGPMRSLVAEKIGFGLGTRENKTRPNVLRAMLGEAGPAPTARP